LSPTIANRKAKRRLDEIVIEISSPLTTNGLVVSEYYRRINIAIAGGATLRAAICFTLIRSTAAEN